MFTRSHVQLRTGTTSSNFHRDRNKSSSMATIRVQIQSKNDNLKSSSKMPSCSFAPRIAQELWGYRETSIRTGRCTVAQHYTSANLKYTKHFRISPEDTFMFTRSHVRLGAIGTTGNFYRDWKMYGSMVTIRVQFPSKENILESTSRTSS